MIEVLQPPQVKSMQVGQPGLRLGYFVKFSELIPMTNLGVVPGEVYEVVEMQTVHVPREFIVPQMSDGPNYDYLNIDLSNNNFPAQTQGLYPAVANELNEIFITMKPFDGFIQVFAPLNQIIFQMDLQNETYDITSPLLRLIGSERPEDSTKESPGMKLYAVQNQTPFFLRAHIEAPLFDKVVFDFLINRCILTQVTDEAERKAAEAVATYIPSLDEIKTAVPLAKVQAMQLNQVGPRRFGPPPMLPRRSTPVGR